MTKISKLAVVLIGTVMAGFGVQLIVAANLGSDSLSTLILGLIQHSGLAFGRWSQLLSLSFLLITFLYRRQLLGWGSLINTLAFGEAIQILARFIGVDGQRSFGANLVLLILGFALMALGTAIYLQANLGAGPLEGLMFCICERIGFSVKLSRILIDLTIVTVGFLLGGPLGLGTIMAIFALGPMIEGAMSLLNLFTKPGNKLANLSD